MFAGQGDLLIEIKQLNPWALPAAPDQSYGLIAWRPSEKSTVLQFAHGFSIWSCDISLIAKGARLWTSLQVNIQVDIRTGFALVMGHDHPE